MSLTHILVFVLTAFFTGWLLPARWRAWALMGGSLLAIYWLQPSTPIRHLDFWLPTASIALTVFVWTITRPADHNDGHSALVGALVMVALFGE